MHTGSPVEGYLNKFAPVWLPLICLLLTLRSVALTCHPFVLTQLSMALT